MPLSQTSITQACAAGAGVLTLSNVPPVADGQTYDYLVAGDLGAVQAAYFLFTDLPLTIGGLDDDTYTVTVTSGDAIDTRRVTIACGGGSGGPGGLLLDALSATAETAALSDGTATIQASGGTAPLVATIAALSRSQPATAGTPTTFSGLPAGPHTVRVTDSAAPTPSFVEGTVTVAAYVAPVTGCQDEYASNYDPLATVAGACSYNPSWRSAWQEVAVAVPAVPGMPASYLSARLSIGFRAGHPLAATRPLGAPQTLRATIGPDGLATFRLGPYLRSALGTPDGAGGYRLDLNSPTAHTADLYVGYELRRLDGSMLAHGYALNAAVPDGELEANGELLTPFARLPVWPGFDAYPVSALGTFAPGIGQLEAVGVDLRNETLRMPCPANPLPVAWLAPGGGYGYWVFTGRPVLGDEVGEGQAYTEAGTGERRYSDRGQTRRTISADSGIFRGTDLLEGLRTLVASPQVWYQPVAGGPWVAVTLEGGSFTAGRMGVGRQQVAISFSEAAPRPSQGQ